MDLLHRYYEQTKKPIMKRQIVSTSMSGESGFVRLVMRISGGKIHDARTANYLLLAVAGVLMVVALVVFFSK